MAHLTLEHYEAAVTNMFGPDDTLQNKPTLVVVKE
jgi:hypothetical protein